MFLTDFADAAVTLPLAALVLAALLLAGSAPAALAWSASVGATFFAVLALKLVFGVMSGFGCVTGIVSPSGHTAGGTIVYAGLVRVLGLRRAPSFAVAVCLAVAIGVSRLALGCHTPGEVLLGGGAGLAGTAVMLHVLGEDVLAGARARGMLAAAAVALVVVLHGQHAPFEHMLQQWRGCLPSAGRPASR